MLNPCAPLADAAADAAIAHRILAENAEVWRVRLAVDFGSTLRAVGLPDAAVEWHLARMLMVALGVPTTTKLAAFVPAARAVIELYDERGIDHQAIASIARDECLLRFMREARGF